MPTTVQPTMENLLPPTDVGAKKAPSKEPSESFDTALSNARPKRQKPDEKPAIKKTHARRAPQKDVPVKAKKAADDESTTSESDEAQTEEQPGDPTSDEKEQEAADAPVAKQKADAKPDQPTDTVTLDQNTQLALQTTTPIAKDPHAAIKQDEPAEKTEKTEQKSPSPAAASTSLKAVKKSPNQATAKRVNPAADDDETTDDQAAASKDSSDDDDDQSLPADTTPQVAAKSNQPHPPQHAQATDTVDAETAPQLKQEASQTLQAPATPAQDQSDDQSMQPVDVNSDHADATAQIDPAAAIEHAAANTALTLDVSPKPPAPAPATPHVAPPPPPPAPPEVRFAEANHPQIVSGIRGQLLPDGGTMHIRLDPPELGALQVSIHMQDGVVSASFQTSNDEATKLLSHSLAQLKHVLEGQGVSVDKLHVTQAPRDQQAGNNEEKGQQSASDNSGAKQEQQRRELLQRMWRRLTNGSDPLDMTA